jgi:hypothetical protein
MKRRGELMMIQRAVNQGWDMSAAEREKCLKLIQSVAADPNASDREILRATRIAMTMESHNQVDEIGGDDRDRIRRK